ncbi:hypothetical protein SAMN05444397_102234 [Flavobacterium aquidurense]|nr:hypothetical protein SAMN05444397_102234 [Flavobacterium aquidurense]
MNHKIVFTSDLYFGQTNISRGSEHPFASVEEMDLALIKRRNEKVNAEDISLIKHKCF